MAKLGTFFQYDKCSTCRTARKTLEKLGVSFANRPIVEKPPTIDELRDLWQRSGEPLKRFFNTSGLSYRILATRTKVDALSDDEKLSLLARDGKLIRRPIFDDGKRVFIGF